MIHLRLFIPVILCEEFRHSVFDFIDEDLPAAWQYYLDDHMQSCTECRQYHADVLYLSEKLTAAAEEDQIVEEEQVLYVEHELRLVV